MPTLAVSPVVSDLRTIPELTSDEFDVVGHRHRLVWLVVDAPGYGRNRAARHELPQEHDAPAPSVSCSPSHVEPQVHFLETAVTRKRPPSHLRLQEQKSYHAQVDSAVVRIQLGPGGYVLK